jgi:hypothetical protein
MGSARVLRKESDYNETMATKKERVSTAIEKSDYIPGHIYETACGSSVVFTGARYVQNITLKNAVPSLTKMTKKYYAIDKGALHSNSSWYYISDHSSRKFVKDLGMHSDWNTELEAKLQRHFLSNNAQTVAFEKERPVNPEYEFVRTNCERGFSVFRKVDGVMTFADSLLYKMSFRNIHTNTHEVIGTEIILENGFETVTRTFTYMKKSVYGYHDEYILAGCENIYYNLRIKNQN